MSARVAIGVGLRRGAAAADVMALVETALETARGLEPKLDCSGARLFTHESKRSEQGLVEAARLLTRDLVFVTEEALAAVDALVTTRSPRVEALFGIGSMAEAAALAGAAGFPSPFGRGWREAPGEGLGSRQDGQASGRANPADSRAPHPPFGHLLPMGEGRARPFLLLPRIANASVTCAIAKGDPDA